MSSQAYSFKTALVTGGGGGIGKALSQQLIKDGKKVIIAGRTESTLKQTAQEIGADFYVRIPEKADQEIDINIRGPMHLILQLMKHFKSKPNAVVVNVSSVLGFVPFSTLNPVYCATKSWQHFWSMSLRKQLEKTDIKVVEIAPPMVATDLHRERENPDDNKKSNAPQTMEVGEFVDEVVQKWKKGETMITAGPGNKIVGIWKESMEPLFEKMT
ncbi:hypothetical protein GRF29_69g973573 [Pseudopithomyces chartarum]|uniref:Uncharacterized protein n=1 Tax=Pseudopithomyces chartarum TaxID=1892770 RepID=A0AAN6RH42_9PLEO|nr:hypothetical protein GRF29_69g973573 [Pseudopithomyces chartarum]